MARPSTAKKRRAELLPLMADAFSELGYRRATTAELAARCEVQENILYRLWDDKKAMFLAVIDYLFTWRMDRTRALLEGIPDDEDPVPAMIDDAASNIGKDNLHRIIHAALGEIGDFEIMSALRELYRHNYEMILDLLGDSEDSKGPPHPATEKDIAWALMGVVTMMSLAGELKLLGPRQQTQIFKRTARALLGLEASSSR